MQNLDTLLDTLADGRQLIRVATPLAATLLPGQRIVSHADCFPLLRHDACAQTVDLVVPAQAILAPQTWQLAGQALTPNIAHNLRLLTFNDGIFAALHFLFNQSAAARQRVSVIAQFDGALPFHPCPSRHYSPNLPGHVIAALPLLDDWGVFNRIVHSNAPGCYDGSVDDLRALFPDARTEVQLT